MIDLCSACRGYTRSVNGLDDRYKAVKYKGRFIGDYIYKPRRCKACKLLQFYKIFRPFKDIAPRDPILVTQEEFNSASDTVGYSRGGSTASEYTMRISRPADETIYYLRALASIQWIRASKSRKLS